MNETGSDRFRMKVKQYSLLMRYYLRSAARRWTGLFPFVLFCISFGLFAIVMIPSIGERLGESSLLCNRPQSLVVSGVVWETVSLQNGKVYRKPAARATVESGGFRVSAREDGSYELRFAAEGTRDIPVIFRFGEQEKIIRISFPPRVHRVEREYAFK